MKHPVIYLFLLIAINKISNKVTFPQTDKTCKEDQSCVAKKDCPPIIKSYEKISSKSINVAERKKIIKDLRSQICNKKSSAFCCLDLDKVLATKVKPEDEVKYGIFLPKEELGECGLTPTGHAGFIIGGKKSAPGQFPFAALLGIKILIDQDGDGTKDLTIRWICGGSLINNWYVVTAAHCGVGRGRLGKRLSQVRLGDWQVTTKKDCISNGRICLPPYQEFEIGGDSFIPHPNYIPKSKTSKDISNDIALIRLPNPAKTNIGVRFVCLPPPSTNSELALRLHQESFNATVIGWGHTNSLEAALYPNSGGDFQLANVASFVQQFVSVPLLNKGQCEAKWQPLNLTIEDTKICAGDRTRSACGGDSWGPMVFRDDTEIGSETENSNAWVLLGIVSFGSKFCTKFPTIYTGVSYYIYWIMNTIEA